jgi:flagellar hook-associated protein 3 FlgL
MRITNNMIARQQLDGLQQNMSALATAQAKVSSGKKFLTAADDPAGVSAVMGSSTSLRAVQQYQTNVDRATQQLNSEDTVLQQLGDVLTRAREIGVSMANGTEDANDRTAAASESEQLLRSAAALGNTMFGDDYLFGGQQSNAAPFSVTGSAGSVDYTTTNPTGERPVAVGGGRTITAVHDGSTIFLDTGAMDALKNLTTALATNDVAGINTATTALQSAFTEVQTAVGETGGRGNQLQMISSNLSAYSGNLTALKSDLQDVDYESAVTDMVTRQNAYQAAMMATSRVMGITLTDYLK